MSISLHRKYRPQTVSELDQEKIRIFFEQILKTGNFAQTYLFSGPRGTGKTSGARILAKIINCEQNRQHEKGRSLLEPCNICDTCKAITSGYSGAVREMDAASNRGIDDIRALREQVSLAPVGAKYSVYIVDEVHMLTSEAFNALLKTLEEPPKHVIFCLATTEQHKLPETIVSRCTVLRYTKSTTQEIVHALERVVKGDGLKVEPEALQLIAEKSDGSFRDGVNMLQQLPAQAKPITLSEAERVIGVSTSVFVADFIAQILTGDVHQALKLIHDAEQNGQDMKDLAKAIVASALDSLRTKLKAQNSVDQSLVDLIEVFSQSFKRFSEVPIPTIALEMAAVEFCLKHGVTQRTIKPTQPPPAASLPEKKNTQIETPPPRTKKEPLEIKPHETNALDINLDTNIVLALADVHKKWAELLRLVGQHNQGLVTLLKRGSVTECLGNRITLSVGYEFHKEQIEQDRYIRVVEECLSQLFAGKVFLSVAVSKKVGPKTSPHQNISGAIKTSDESLVSAVEEAFGV